MNKVHKNFQNIPTNALGVGVDLSLQYDWFRLQSGPKVLDHTGIFMRDFPPLPFLMLIHTIL